jgi:hypothetical protein
MIRRIGLGGILGIACWLVPLTAAPAGEADGKAPAVAPPNPGVVAVARWHGLYKQERFTSAAEQQPNPNRYTDSRLERTEEVDITYREERFLPHTVEYRCVVEKVVIRVAEPAWYRQPATGPRVTITPAVDQTVTLTEADMVANPAEGDLTFLKEAKGRLDAVLQKLEQARREYEQNADPLVYEKMRKLSSEAKLHWRQMRFHLFGMNTSTVWAYVAYPRDDKTRETQVQVSVVIKHPSLPLKVDGKAVNISGKDLGAKPRDGVMTDKEYSRYFFVAGKFGGPLTATLEDGPKDAPTSRRTIRVERSLIKDTEGASSSRYTVGIVRDGDRRFADEVRKYLEKRKNTNDKPGPVGPKP